MNCPIIRRRLLEHESPARPEADVATHLDECPACRTWQRRLVAVERQISLLPVPASTGRERFVQQLWTAPKPQTVGKTTPAPAIRPRMPSWQSSPRDRARQKLALATALAATMIVFTMGFFLWSKRPDAIVPPAPTFYATLMQRRDEIINAKAGPQQRLEKIAKFAQSLSKEAADQAQDADPERLGTLAKVYGQLVTHDLPTYARALPVQERPDVIGKINDQLIQTDSLVRGLVEVRPEAMAPLQAIAQASRDGHKTLVSILNEKL